MNKKLKKGLTVSSAAAMGMSIVLPTVSVIAAPAVTNGWVNQNGTWYYYNNGTLVKNGWAKDSKGWCFLNAVDGAWVQEGWAKDNTGWGYIRNGYWVEHATYAKDANGWQFIGTNGYWDTTVAAKATNPIDDATAAVVKAEGSKLAADVDAATALVAALNDAIPEKAALTTRLNAVVTNFEVGSVTVVDANHIKVVFTQAVDEQTATDTDNYSFAAVDSDVDDLDINEAEVQEDGKTVIISLNDGGLLTKDADTDYTVKVTDVKNTSGDVMDTYKEVLTLVDDVKPTVTEVKMSNRDKLQIVFSEDVKNVGDITIENEDGDEIDVDTPAIDSDDNNIINITGLGTEDDGAYTVTIKDVKDLAGNKIAETTENFTLEEDNSDPEVKSVKAISATTLKVTFDEGVTNAFKVELPNDGAKEVSVKSITAVSGTNKEAYYVTLDSKTTLDDNLSHKVVISDFEDFANNSGKSYTRFVKFDNSVGAELESTEGTIKTYDGDKYAVFSYDSDVVLSDVSYVNAEILDGSFVDEDGDVVDQDIAADDIYDSKTLSDLDDNQIAIKLANYDIGDYTVTLPEGFVDVNGADSDEVDVTFSVTTEEEDDVTVDKVWVSDNKLYVQYSDEVDGDSALDVSNYELDGDNVFGSAKFTNSDKDTVKLSLGDGELEEDVTTSKDYRLTIENIEDSNANDVDDYDSYDEGDVLSFKENQGPQVDQVLVVASNKVQVIFDEAIGNLGDIDEDDFEVKVDNGDGYESVIIDSVSYSSSGKVWTLTLDDDDALDNYENVKAGTSADFDGEDVNGNDGEASSLKVADTTDADADADAKTALDAINADETANDIATDLAAYDGELGIDLTDYNTLTDANIDKVNAAVLAGVAYDTTAEVADVFNTEVEKYVAEEAAADAKANAALEAAKVENVVAADKTGAGTDGQVTVTWDAVDGATKYVVSYSATGESGTKTVTGDVTTTLTGLTAGTEYTITVKASNGTVDSLTSDNATVTPVNEVVVP